MSQLVVGALLSIAVATTDLSGEPMRILTYPTGLVVGELPVTVELGSEETSAELFLDGSSVCAMTAKREACSVDLGPDPHVHLLELLGSSGRRSERWLNRPGQEAELELVPLAPEGDVCSVGIRWAHPEQLGPHSLEVTYNGRSLKLLDGGQRTRFPCPSKAGSSDAVVASAVFPDGRMVEAVALIGGFGEQAVVELTAVPLVVSGRGTPVCEPSEGMWPVVADRLEKSGYDVVVVLDPEASYRNLYTSGWDAGRLPPIASNARESEKLFRQGGKDDEPKPRNSWLKAKTTIDDAERLWYVAPDADLSRIDGFGAGRSQWLELLFKFGLAEVAKPYRIADAVAASGLVAGGGARRRVVILLLGNNVHRRDESIFTPAQAREYLAEVGVPLVVLRNARPRDDGWPTGLATLNMDAFDDNLRIARQLVDRQCVAWLSGEVGPQRLAELLPDGVDLAGRDGDAPESPRSFWSRVEITPEAAAVTVVGEHLDVTAITVLVSATSEDGGRPITDLDVDDLVLVEDGVEVEVSAVEPVSSQVRDQTAEAMDETARRSITLPELEESLPVTVFVDATFGGRASLRKALDSVAGSAERLVTLGPVEVIRSDRHIETVLAPTRDADQLEKALRQVTEKVSAIHTIERIRRNFIRDVRNIPSRMMGLEVEAMNESLVDPLTSQPKTERMRIGARGAAGEEHTAISLSLERLRQWAAFQPIQQAGLLILVGSGYDVDPTPFYTSYVQQQEPESVSIVREDLRAWRHDDEVNDIGRELASAGWRVVMVAGDSFGGVNNATSAEAGPGNKVQQFLTSAPEGIADPTTRALVLEPLTPHKRLARPSGGDVVIAKAGLDAALDQSAGWYRVTYQVARPPDPIVRSLEVRPVRPGLEISASEVVAGSSLDRHAEARVRQLLEPEARRGELAVALIAGPVSKSSEVLSSSRIDATVDLASLAAVIGDRQSRIRISIAIASPAGSPTVIHRLETLKKLPSAGEWTYTFPAQWPGDAGSLAVVIEELSTGVWGGATMTFSAGTSG